MTDPQPLPDNKPVPGWAYRRGCRRFYAEHVRDKIATVVSATMHPLSTGECGIVWAVSATYRRNVGKCIETTIRGEIRGEIGASSREEAVAMFETAYACAVALAEAQVRAGRDVAAPDQDGAS